MVNNPILYAAVMILWLVAFLLFLIISSVSGIVNVMCHVILAAACLIILGFFGSHYNSSVGSVKSKLQNVKSQYQYAYWKVLTAERLEFGLFSSSSEVTGISSVSTPY
jgi:hypothetical protein